ncbi:MAG: ATP-binding cassette domain-containing protein [Bacteroidota bacterium]|nr:ATP-binding cassette domain-containing protein [Bacteroidota bacterium]
MTNDTDINDPETVVKINNLYKSFGKNEVLKGINLTLSKGENLVVIGRSGCGKSVLAKCIIGLVNADQGKVFLFGNDITGYKRKELNLLRSKIGFLFQSNALYDSMNISDNLTFTLQRREKGKSRKELDMQVEEVLENVGLPESKYMMPAELSGGMKKRIGLARALILKPQLMLYDEPTTGLDPITSREISQLMLEMQHAYQISSVIISHDLQCTRITANRIIALIDGKCYAGGTYTELARSMDPKVNSFFI